MACNASKLPFIRAISARTFAAQAQAAVSPSKSYAGLTSTVLPNKIFVTALDEQSPVARITIAYKAGSRFESSDEAGLSHILRAAAGTTTSGASAFAIMRNLQQLGANLTTTSDRETVLYTLEASKDNLEAAVKYLNDVACKQLFQPWEFETFVPQVKYEIAGLSPQVRAIDLLHKAAFRRGLGNSLFCPPRQVGAISSESLQHFVNNNFTAGRCAVAAVGLSLDRAVAIAQTLSLPQGSGKPDTPSPYKGGEMRKEMGGEFTHVALAGQGSGISNAKDALALAVLAKAISSGPQVKWGGDNSPLGKAISTETSGGLYAANGFNVSYADTGLFGILITAPKDVAGKAVQAAAQVLKKASSVGSDALKRGRAQLQADVLNAADTPSAMVQGLAIQGVLVGSLKKSSDLADEIAKITDSDISTAASKIGKLSMGAAGSLINVPYVDEL